MHPNTRTENPSVSVFEAAYARMLPAILAFEAKPLAPITIEAHLLAATVLAAAPKVRLLRPQMAKLPRTDVVACVDALEDVAHALVHANMLHQSNTRPTDALVALGEQGATLRARLFADVQALVARDAVRDEALESYRGTTGYRVIAADLILLAGVLDAAWPALDGRTLVTRDELVAANGLAEQLLVGFGGRSQTSMHTDETQRIRSYAYNLVLARYDEARRAIAYLRWREEDANTYAPSPYAGRGNGNHRRRVAEAETERPITAGSTLVTSPDDDPFLR